MTKAKHMLNYHALTQGESKSSAEFVDRELREYLALRDMGVQIDDSICLTKFIQQDTTNTKHKQLAQTTFTTPNMTLGPAASLFETYNPPSHLCPRREEARRCLAQSSGRPTPSSNSSNRKPSVGWGTTKRGWGRDDEFLEGSK